MLEGPFLPPGYAGGSGGGGYVGGRKSGSATIPPSQRAAPAQNINWTFQVVLAATGAPQLAPGANVPPGSTCRVRANNGSGTGNAHMVYVGASRDAVVPAGSGTPLAPLDDIAFPIGNTGRIWVSGIEGDGVVVSIINNAGNY